MVELFWKSRSAECADVIVEGFAVPNVKAYRVKGGPEDGQLSLSLERHGHAFCSIDAGEAELQRWLPFLANCMATTAGFSCFGKNSIPLNPFKCKVHTIMYADDDLDEPTEETTP